MDAALLGSSSLTLSDLAQRFRLHHTSLPCKVDVDHVDIRGGGELPKSGFARKAAVLICIFEGDSGKLRVILTERSSSLSSHSGEVALPGGKMDESDKDEVATALRDAQEEIGLDSSLVDVVCVLDPFTMKNGMVVVPVVGLLYDKSAFHPTPNVAEVEAIFDAPLEMFLEDKNRREVEREWMGEKYLLHHFDYKAEDRNYVIFALTAGILIETASLVCQRSPAFEEMKPKFWNKASTSL